jgi:lipopolysaccharide export system permease protein
MTKIIYRSITKELFFAFFLTITSLNSILMMEKLLRLSRLLSGIGVKVFDMIKIIFYLQPQLLMLTIPMSLLLSTLLVYGRMNLDSEIIILKTSGMDFKRISVPVVLLGGFCFFASIIVSFYAGPKSSVKLRDTVAQIIAVQSTLSVEEGTFNTSFKDIVIIVKNRKPPDILEQIFIYDSRNQKEPRILMAKEGKFFMQDSLNIGLFLKNGYINITKDNSATELFFDRYNMTLNLGAAPPEQKKIELTPIELFHKTKVLQTYKEKSALYLEFYRRLSLPAVCLLLILLGPPLSLVAGKTGRLGGLSLGLLVFTVYYMLLIYGENLVMAGRVPPYIGAWLATIMLGMFSLVLFKKGTTY